MLLEAAARVQQPQETTQAAMERVRPLDDCQHEGLVYTTGNGVCDVCEFWLRKYLYRGCGCGFQICLWCITLRLHIGALRNRNPSKARSQAVAASGSGVHRTASLAANETQQQRARRLRLAAERRARQTPAYIQGRVEEEMNDPTRLTIQQHRETTFQALSDAQTNNPASTNTAVPTEI